MPALSSVGYRFRSDCWLAEVINVCLLSSAASKPEPCFGALSKVSNSLACVEPIGCSFPSFVKLSKLRSRLPKSATISVSDLPSYLSGSMLLLPMLPSPLHFVAVLMYWMLHNRAPPFAGSQRFIMNLDVVLAIYWVFATPRHFIYPLGAKRNGSHLNSWLREYPYRANA